MPVRDFFDNLYKVIVIVIEYTAVFVLKRKFLLFSEKAFSHKMNDYFHIYNSVNFVYLAVKHIVKEKKCKVFYMH